MNITGKIALGKNTSLKALYTSYRQEAAPDHVLYLKFDQTPVKISSNSEALCKRLRDYFTGFVCNAEVPTLEILAIEAAPPALVDADLTDKQPDPGKSKIKEAFFESSDGRVVKKKLTGMVFCFGAGFNLAVGPCLENDNQIVNFINNRFIEHVLNRGWLLGHAAALHYHGRGLSICGFSGMGKSTLSLHVMRRGVSFVSNDRVMIKNNAVNTHLLGVAKWPRVNPGTLLHNSDIAHVLPASKREAYTKLDPETLWQLEEKYDVFIEHSFGANKVQIETPLDLLVVLNWKERGAPLKIRKIALEKRTELLDSFMKAEGLFYQAVPEMRDFDRSKTAYLSQLKQVSVVEFSEGIDFERGADFCYQYLETGRLDI